MHLILFVLLLALPPAARAQEADTDPVPSIAAARASVPVRIDGRLDEAAWAAAAPVTELRQLDPQEGAPVSERTEIRVLYDEDALYVGARFHDAGEVRTRLGRRDMPMGDSDWLTVVLDSYHDHRTAFGFEINPSGVRRDQTRAGGREDDSWDPVWEGVAAVDDGGWTAELRIPFSQLRFNRSEAEVAEGNRSEAEVGEEEVPAGQTWGLQLERTIARKREFAQWSFTPRTQPGGIPRYGHLTGLEGLRTGKRMEVLPYTVARAEYIDPAGNPFRGEREYDGSFGVDVKYRVTSDLTLDATINPDFGQVEVDPAQVNLSAIETRYEEKRPFFIEGAELFDFGNAAGNSVFYSRRIGRRPQLGVGTPNYDAPDAARILGAAKLTGRTRSGWSVGVLDAVTQKAEARYDDGTVRGSSAVVEPMTNYFLGRARRDFRAGQTVVGGMLAAVHRRLESDALKARLHAAAYTGGVDFRHEWAGRTWSVDGFLSGSYVSGDRRAITATQALADWRYFGRPDAGHLEVDTLATSLAGLAGQLSLWHRVGRQWEMAVDFATITPGYEVNDIGFQYRADRIDGQAVVAYRETRPGDVIRTWRLEGSARHERNYGGDHIQTALGLEAMAQLLNYWQGFVFLRHSPEAVDVRLTRGGPAALRPTSTFVFGGVGSDGRKPYAVGVRGSYQTDAAGGWSRSTGVELEIKPAASWSLSLGPTLSRSRSAAQYLGAVTDPRAEATFGRRYLFAGIDQTTLSMETRLNLTFRPGLSLQLYAQPYIASGDYGAPAELAAPRTFRFLVYGEDVGEVERVEGGVRVYPEGKAGAARALTVPERDFNFRSLRGSAVLRWEWRPGSTLYLAWQQQRESFEAGVGDFDFARDRAGLFGAAPDNVFVLKVNYWLNP